MGDKVAENSAMGKVESFTVLGAWDGILVLWLRNLGSRERQWHIQDHFMQASSLII